MVVAVLGTTLRSLTGQWIQGGVGLEGPMVVAVLGTTLRSLTGQYIQGGVGEEGEEAMVVRMMGPTLRSGFTRGSKHNMLL